MWSLTCYSPAPWLIPYQLGLGFPPVLPTPEAPSSSHDQLSLLTLHWLPDHSLHASYWLVASATPLQSEPISIPFSSTLPLHSEDGSSMEP